MWQHIRQTVFLMAAVFVGSCVFDPDNPCGTNQVLSERDDCICKDGLVFGEDGKTCVPCGEHQVWNNGVCECEEGYDMSGNTCVPIPPGWGDACSGQDPTCLDPWTCYVIDQTEGYCTKTNCSSSEECYAGYACETSENPTVCKRPPVGLNEPCENSEDCEDFEATWCDTFESGTCQVENCTLAPDNCFEGYMCCNLPELLESLPTLCVPPGTCPVED